jgi:hypothetical protein
VGEDLDLQARDVGALPIVRALLQRLGWRKLLEDALGAADRRLRLSHAEVALLLLYNFTLSRHPLYGVPEWLDRFGAQALGLGEQELATVNDDRLGRTLDKLFTLDLRTLTTQLVLATTGAFGVELTRFHNDSTSITF